jgi:hypothetical protein
MPKRSAAAAGFIDEAMSPKTLVRYWKTSTNDPV